MSADEIKALAQQAFVDGMANHQAGLLKAEARCKQYSNALLTFAEMVERCEKLIRPCNLEDAPCVPSDTGYCDSCDVPKHNDMINYILKGATDERKD